MSLITLYEAPTRVVVYDTSGAVRLSSKWDGFVGISHFTRCEAFTIGHAEWLAADGRVLHTLDGAEFNSRDVVAGQYVTMRLSL